MVKKGDGVQGTKNKKYMVWNNKGGVGKTFLTYALSVEYAKTHPSEDIVVVDLCPQANVSEIILGGNGKGEACLNKYAETATTIAGYIKGRFDKSQRERFGNEIKYFIQAKQENSQMPENMYLLPGDIDLDICSKLIAHMGSSPTQEAWRKSRLLLIDLIDSLEGKDQRPKTFFIDCNPSFANYTELGILGSNRIIVPCTADAASIRGIKNLIRLIYGINLDETTIDSDFLNFYKEATNNRFELPRLHLLIQNRSRTTDQSATKAYQAYADEIDKIVKRVDKEHPELFTSDRLDSRIKHVKDGNTLTAIINHEGCPISSLKHAKYNVYGQETQANQAQIQALMSDIQSIVNLL